jgi:hypothetical protein
MELGVVTVDEFVHILTIGDVGEVYLVDDGGCVIRLEVVCLDGWREDIASFRVEFVSCILSGGRRGYWDGAKVEGADAGLVASEVVEFGIACEDLDFDGVSCFLQDGFGALHEDFVVFDEKGGARWNGCDVLDAVNVVVEATVVGVMEGELDVVGVVTTAEEERVLAMDFESEAFGKGDWLRIYEEGEHGE